MWVSQHSPQHYLEHFHGLGSNHKELQGVMIAFLPASPWSSLFKMIFLNLELIPSGCSRTVFFVSSFISSLETQMQNSRAQHPQCSGKGQLIVLQLWVTSTAAGRTAASVQGKCKQWTRHTPPARSYRPATHGATNVKLWHQMSRGSSRMFKCDLTQVAGDACPFSSAEKRKLSYNNAGVSGVFGAFRITMSGTVKSCHSSEEANNL